MVKIGRWLIRTLLTRTVSCTIHGVICGSRREKRFIATTEAHGILSLRPSEFLVLLIQLWKTIPAGYGSVLITLFPDSTVHPGPLLMSEISLE